MAGLESFNLYKYLFAAGKVLNNFMRTLRIMYQITPQQFVFCIVLLAFMVNSPQYKIGPIDFDLGDAPCWQSHNFEEAVKALANEASKSSCGVI